MAAYHPRGKDSRDGDWDADRVRGLREHLRLTQRAFAEELNARQQTVSEWETGRYRPRGPSARLLSLIAEDAGFGYASAPDQGGPSQDASGQATPDQEAPRREGADSTDLV